MYLHENIIYNLFGFQRIDYVSLALLYILKFRNRYLINLEYTVQFLFCGMRVLFRKRQTILIHYRKKKKK